MEFLWNKLTEWLKEMLVGGVMSNLTGLFDSINDQVSEIAGTVGATPQGWNSGVFSMVQSLSNNVVVPIAGVLLAIVMAMELIQMIVDRNNMNDFDVGQVVKWVFKSFFAVILVTSTYAAFFSDSSLAYSSCKLLTEGSFLTPSSSKAFFAALCSRMSPSCSARYFFE